jgi:lincosamide nucleotidyltransferase A/C/D/E
MFPDEALSGEGVVHGLSVRCEPPVWVLRFHTGYPPREVDREDMGRLSARYGIPLPGFK